MRQMMFALAVAAIAAPALAADAPTPAPEGGDAMATTASEAIAAACGKEAPVLVTWDTFGIMEAKDAAFIIDSKLTFLVDALTKVCADPAMKAEYIKQIDSIELPQAGGAADAMVYIYERGLHVEYFWSAESGVPDTNFVAEEIASRLRGEPMPEP